MSIKTGLLVLGGVAFVGTIAYALTRKGKAPGRRVYVESSVDGGVTWGDNSAARFFYNQDNGLNIADAAKAGDVVVLRIGAGPWLRGTGDLRPVSDVAREFADIVRLMIANGATVIAMPSVLPWTTAIGNLPGAADKVTVLRRASTMLDTWMRSVYSRPGFEGDGLFKAIVDVNAMKAPDGMIDAQYVGADGALNDAGQARLTELVDAAIAEVE